MLIKKLLNKLLKRSEKTTCDPAKITCDPVKTSVKRVYNETAQRRGFFQQASLKPYRSELKTAPEEMKNYSLGCGSPIKFLPPDYFKECPKKVLDLGCGAGLDLSIICQQNPRGINIGVDLSIEMLKTGNEVLSRQLNPPGRPVLINADAENLPFLQKSFDLIISNSALHLVPEKNRLFKRIRSIISDRGEAYISDITLAKGHNLPDNLKQEYLSSNGLFLYGGIIDETQYIDHLQNNFEHVEILERGVFEMDFSKLNDINPQLADQLKTTRYQVVTLLAKPLAQYEIVPAVCNCGRVFRINFYPAVNLTVSPFFKKIIGSVNLPNCNCQANPDLPSSDYPLPFIISDLEKRKMAYVIPERERANLKVYEEMLADQSRQISQSRMTFQIICGPVELLDQFGNSSKKGV